MLSWVVILNPSASFCGNLKTKEAAMKVDLSLSVEDALQLQRFLFDLRHALVVNASSMLWTIPGVPATSYDISQVVLLEDLQCTIAEAVDDVADRVKFAGCSHSF